MCTEAKIRFRGPLTILPPLGLLFVAGVRVRNTQAIKEAEGEKNAAGDSTENGERETGAGDGAAAAKDAMDQDDEEEDGEEAGAMMPVRGPLPPQDGSWASCIRLVNPVEGATVECLELGEAARLFSYGGVLSYFSPFLLLWNFRSQCDVALLATQCPVRSA